jgi:hypothetical protein
LSSGFTGWLQLGPHPVYHHRILAAAAADEAGAKKTVLASCFREYLRHQCGKKFDILGIFNVLLGFFI